MGAWRHLLQGLLNGFCTGSAPANYRSVLSWSQSQRGRFAISPCYPCRRDATLWSPAPEAVCPQGGGESVVDLQARAAAALETITRRNPGKRVLIISHGGFLHATHVHATGHAPPGKNINGSINTLRIDPGQDGQQAGAGEGGRRCTWALVRWGDVDHLHEVGFLHKAFGGGTRG